MAESMQIDEAGFGSTTSSSSSSASAAQPPASVLGKRQYPFSKEGSEFKALSLAESDAPAPQTGDKRARSQASFSFLEPGAGVQVKVSVDTSATSRSVDAERVWLVCVAPLFPTAGSAFAAYRSRYKRRDRLFRSYEADEFAEVRDEAKSTNLFARCRITRSELSSQQLLALKQSARRLSRRAGARKMKQRQAALDTKTALQGNAIMFGSDAGQDKQRLMQLSQPVAISWTGAGIDVRKPDNGRRLKLRLYEGVTPAAAQPARKQRAEEKAADGTQTGRSRGFGYLTESDTGSLTLEYCETLPHDRRDALVGLLFEPVHQLYRMLERAAKLGTLTEAAHGREAPAHPVALLNSWHGADGITPANLAVCGHFLRLLDPTRAVFKRGYSPLVRIVVFWDREGSSVRVADLRNRFIATLASQVFVIHDRLAIQITPTTVSADNKFCAVEYGWVAGDSEQRCFICALPASKWGTFALSGIQPRSVGDMLRTYLGVLFAVLRRHDSAKAAVASGIVPLVETQKMFVEESQSVGARSFPLTFYGNSCAWRLAKLHCGRMLSLPADPSTWTPAEDNRASQTFTKLLVLHAQLHQTEVPAPPADGLGFELDRLHPATAKLHSLKAVGVHLIVDILTRDSHAMPGAGETGGAARQAFRAALLQEASPNLRSFVDHVYAKHVRKMFANPRVFDVLTRRFRSLAFVAACVFQTLYLAAPTRRDHALLLICSNLLLPLMHLCQPLAVPHTDDSHEHKNLSVRNSLYTHSWEHFTADLEHTPSLAMYATSEEELERQVGQLQRFLRRRGANRVEDLAREALAAARSDDAIADYQLQAQSNEEPAADHRAIRGMLFSPSFAQHPDFEQIFIELMAAATNAGLGRFAWSRMDGLVCVADEDAFQKPLSVLLQLPGLECVCLCFARADADCVFCRR